MIEKLTRQPPFPEDIVRQCSEWRIERLGWVVMALLVLAALLGAFSHGPLSDATTTGSGGNLSVAYERLVHKTARHQFVITLARAPQDARIRLSPSFLQSYDIEVLYPVPLHSTSGTDGLDLTFAPSAAGDLTVHIGARAKRFGLATLSVEAGDQSRASFTQLIYP
jgi:hypothetical protein